MYLYLLGSVKVPDDWGHSKLPSGGVPGGSTGGSGSSHGQVSATLKSQLHGLQVISSAGSPEISADITSLYVLGLTGSGPKGPYIPEPVPLYVGLMVISGPLDGISAIYAWNVPPLSQIMTKLNGISLGTPT